MSTINAAWPRASTNYSKFLRFYCMFSRLERNEYTSPCGHVFHCVSMDRREELIEKKEEIESNRTRQTTTDMFHLL